VQFSKGHGTENTFIVLPDPDGALDLTPNRVAALCDRNRGIGADGVLRVVRWAALAEGPMPADDVEWFMDYRNADGSVAEMCGNGVRVYATYLAHRGWLPDGELRLGTRGGIRTVHVKDDEVAVEMGPVRVEGEAKASVDGQLFPGLMVNVGNPHLACVADVPLAAIDLTRPPGHDPALFPHGVNVEFLTPMVKDRIAMRVHERGVGETRSCGTGTVAAVVAALRHAGRTTGTVAVDTPGGPLRVTVDEGTTTLQGPAELVAHGELDPRWWDGTV
jgi:diaminopimelate epimerase